ncbi:Short-chain dehydrogenase [Nocardioides scoriae]|uniref:Short-chain dehydrogenase n=1 Tax=Nocardioides scoriae TaxID=642780 RepID=A0A1H1NS87_9ACTN|nr:SDR family oxidoreductase [Nocardioides scoriae]SDS01836.1 Short-chain dehydrogenase [Nocardioides scoriae]
MSSPQPGSVPRTALVTGASSGIGLATARALLEEGYAVIGTSRDPARIPEADRVEGVSYRALDLDDLGSLPGFCAALRAEGHHVDVLVNNAGESQSGPLEELPLGALERLFRVNVLGPVRLTQLLLPAMRERGGGRVVMVGSMLASFPLAYRSSYVASKAALKGFATAARLEMAPHGVWLTTVEPGSISTGISQRRTTYVDDGSPHAERFARMLQRLDRAERHGTSAERVARTVVEAVSAAEPAPLYAVGSNAPAAFALRRLLPRATVERVVSRRFGQSSRPERATS